jgi:hypothetical protein
MRAVLQTISKGLYTITINVIPPEIQCMHVRAVLQTISKASASMSLHPRFSVCR